MSYITLRTTGMTGFSGLWFGWDRTSAYFGCETSSNYAAVYRFEVPQTVRGKYLQLEFGAQKGFSGAASSQAFRASLTRTDPTQSDIYTQDHPGDDPGLINRVSATVNDLTMSSQIVTVTVPVLGQLSAGETVYLVLSPDRDAQINLSLAYREYATPIVDIFTDPPLAALPVAPRGDVYADDDEIVFRWRHNDPTGYPQTGWRLQVSDDGSSYATLAERSNNAQQFAVSASALGLPGTKSWRVQTRNEVGWGPYCEPESVTIVGATPIEYVAVEGSTWRPTIRWFTADQELAQVVVDGKSYTVFGTVQSFMLPDIVADGSHTVTVRTQNAYGIWSTARTSWSAFNPGMQAFAPSVTLDGTAVVIIVPEDYSDYIIYRDDMPIAKLHGGDRLVDNFAAGLTIYTIRAITGEGYADYTKPVNIVPEEVTIIDCETGRTMQLPLSATQTRVVSFARAAIFAQSRFAGRRYPVSYGSEFEDKSLSLDVAFSDRGDARSFERYFGRLVCVKTEHADMVIGLMTDIKKAADEFITSYTLAVSQVDYPEVIDIDTGAKL